MSDSEEYASDVSDIEESNVPLKPGKERPFFNNKEGMEAKIALLAEQEEPWHHSMEVTIDLSTVTLPAGATGDDEKKQPSIGANAAIEDDFKREMTFYCQAQLAAKEALEKMRTMNKPTQRPEDYFAEMCKTDAHMQKVRGKLTEKKESMEASEKAKKQRQLKKFGKKVQHEVLQRRQKEKKAMMESVDKIKKGKQKLGKGKDDEDIFDVSAKTSGDKKAAKEGGLKRKAKDDKFGFGGKKRKMKQNTNADLHKSDGFNAKTNSNKGAPKKFGQNKNKSANKSSNNTKRMGKARRDGMKNRGGGGKGKK